MSQAGHAAQEILAAGGEPLVFFLVLSLGLGAAARHLLRRTPLPYSVILLVIGLGLGALDRAGLFGESLKTVGVALKMASSLDPHLILFIFLPPLIFESAFSLDKHIFRRISGQVLLLAVPGLLFSTLGIGLIAKGLFPWKWSWFAALMFGALLSATDPVAVVAVLRELGASRQLATLIEGESLLNDGTAIVVFSLFYGALIAGGVAGGPAGVAGQFVWVSIGGLLVGLAIAFAAVEWIRRVFNDAMVEITLTIMFAYLAFFLSEKVLHVSGVLALVSLGLVLGGIGRTRISREVEGFLENFWEMMVYLADTLIFILVGVVIAEHAIWKNLNSWVALAGLYLGIHVVRGATTVVFLPLLRRWGYGLTKKDAAVLVWGGLRGAVGLCLALAAAQDPRIPGEVGGQMLFLCAGVVVLTLVVNGTTIRGLISLLGMDAVKPARAGTLRAAFHRVENEVEATLRALRKDQFLGSADWERVSAYLPRMALPAPLDEPAREDLAADARARILQVEKHSYWRQFHQGLITSSAMRALLEAADSALDRSGPLTGRAELDHIWSVPAALTRFHAVPKLSLLRNYLFFDHLALAYNTARGFVLAQEEARSLLEAIAPDGTVRESLAREIDANRTAALKLAMNLKEAFPGEVRSIETRTAAGTVLIKERSSIQRLVREGVLDEEEAALWVATVEGRMKSIFGTPQTIRLPKAGELLGEVTWLAGLKEETREMVAAAVKERTFPAEEVIFREGDRGDALFIVARGAVCVFKSDGDGEEILDILGPGSVIGEISALTGLKRTASVRARTPLVALWLEREDLAEIMAASEKLSAQLWHTAGERFAENLLAHLAPFRRWSKMELRMWLQRGSVEEPPPGETVRLEGPAVLLAGTVPARAGLSETAAPALLTAAEARFSEGTLLYLCPPVGRGEGSASPGE